MAAGFFVVLEGPEGAGKSTLTRALAQRMRAGGLEPVVVREPGGTPAAESLRSELLDADRGWTPEAELLYLCAARADLVAKVIGPALARGAIVLSDRFELSTRAYQIAGRGLPREQTEWVNRAATGGLTANLTLVIDVPVGLGQARQIAAGKARDRLDRESAAFHARVVDAYLAAQGPGIVHLDGTQDAGVVGEQAWDALMAVRPDLFPRGQ